MCTERLVQPGIVGFETPREPGIQRVTKPSIVELRARREILHQVANLVQQALMVGLDANAVASSRYNSFTAGRIMAANALLE